MSSSAAGTPPWSPANWALAATASSPSSPACMSIPSGAAARNSPTACATPPTDRVLQPGGRRPPLTKKDPELVPILLGLLEDVTGGDPQSGARYVRPSLEALSCELA